MATTTLTSDPAEQTRYRIASWLLSDLEARFAKLGKRAEKIGVPVPTFTIVETIDEPEMVPDLSHAVDGARVPSGRVRTFYVVTITGEAPSYDGWHMAAVIDRDLEEAPDGPHVVHVLDGFTLDEAWRHAPDYCDYCAETLNRTHPAGRKTLVVLDKDGTRKTVGTTCLKDFLGHTAPTTIAGWIETLSSLGDLLGGYADDSDEIRGGPRTEMRWLPAHYLAWVARSIRENGWTARSTAREYGSFATADAASNDMDDFARRRTDKYGVLLVATPPTDQDQELADAALEWAQAITVDYDTNDYIANVSAVANKSGWRYRDLGIGASIVTAYQREMEMEIKRKQRTADLSGSVHLGQPRDKLEFAGTVYFTRYFDGQYGTTQLIKVLTDDGNVLVWFASHGGPTVDGRAIEQGDKVTGKGTVKKHDEYEDVKQTIITRAKLTVVSTD